MVRREAGQGGGQGILPAAPSEDQSAARSLGRPIECRRNHSALALLSPRPQVTTLFQQWDADGDGTVDQH
eukprot:1426460-Prymnesium_polylepis.1